MKILLKTLKYLSFLPLTYILLAFTLSAIPYNTTPPKDPKNFTIYIHSNGVHADIALPFSSLQQELKNCTPNYTHHSIISYGWGDENFYINTPRWEDLSFKNAFSALFLESSTLMHITPYHQAKSTWKKVAVSEKQFRALEAFIIKSFQRNTAKESEQLPNINYGYGDSFYRANGSYSCFYTCNSWANEALKVAGVKTCLWTPFDFSLLKYYK